MLKKLGSFTLIAAGLVAGALFAGTAAAGECPADKLQADVRESVDFEPVGVTDTVLSAIDLADEAPMLPGRMMRVRYLTIEPGGVVPWHSHGERPALIYILSGEINEYASNCAAPIVHKAGEVARETHALSHWWKNLGSETVTLLSFDIRMDPADHNM
jgi:quercetin dioxygenase-like cupin family protein